MSHEKPRVSPAITQLPTMPPSGSLPLLGTYAILSAKEGFSCRSNAILSLRVVSLCPSFSLLDLLFWWINTNRFVTWSLKAQLLSKNCAGRCQLEYHMKREWRFKVLKMLLPHLLSSMTKRTCSNIQTLYKDERMSGQDGPCRWKAPPHKLATILIELGCFFYLVLTA